MRRHRDLSFRKSTRTLIIVIVILVSSLYSVYFTSIINANFEREKEMMTSASQAQQKAIIREQVENAIQCIEIERQYNPDLPDSSVQKIILKKMQKIRFSHGGYIFINTYHGQALLFDGRILESYKDISNMTDPDGKRLFDLEVKAARKAEGDFMTYHFKPLNSDTLLPKISFMKGYEEWQWIVGAGIYLDDIHKELALIADKHFSDLIRQLVIGLVIILLVSLIILFITNRYITIIDQEISIFSDFFQQLSLTNKGIDTSEFRFVEYKQLAIEANKMVDEKQKLEEELQNSEANYRTLVENAGDAIVKGDPEGHFVQVNTSACKLTRFSRNELLNMNMQNLFSESQLNLHPLEYDRLKEGYTVLKERLIKTKNGKYIPIEMSSCLMNDGHYLSVIRDISARKTSEAELLKSKQRFLSLYDNAAIPIWEEDFSAVKTFFDEQRSQGVSNFAEYFENHPSKILECASMVKVIDVNRASYKLFKTDNKNELLGGITNFYDKGVIDVFKQELIALSEGKTEFEGEIKIRDKQDNIHQVSFKLAIPPESEQSLDRVLVSFIDITDKNDALSALNDSENRYQELVNLVPEGLVVHTNGIIRYCNESANAILKTPPNDSLINKRVLDYIHPDSIDLAKERIHESLSQGKPATTVEEKFVCANGDVIICEVKGVPFNYLNQPAILIVFSDITKKKKEEEELNKYRIKLEELVRDRTKEIEQQNLELIDKNKELERFNQLFIGREFRIKELKTEIENMKMNLQ